MIAAAEKTIISVVAFEVFASDLVACFGFDGSVAFTAFGEGVGLETLATCGTTGFGSGGMATAFSGGAITVCPLTGGTVGGGTLIGALAVGTSSGGIGTDE